MLIAERILRLQQGDTHHGVPVRVFLPVADQAAWSCGWEIHWPDSIRSGTALGHDALQALVLALQAIGAQLYASDAHAAGELSWTSGRRGYGVPVSRLIRDRLEGDDADTL